EVATLYIDLKPTTKTEAIKRKLESPRKKNSWSEHLIWQLKLSKPMFDLLKRSCGKEEFLDVDFLSNHIKQIPIQVTGFDDIDKAISTVGGISLDEISNEFELNKIPNHYAIGEMLDWDAPTGGYLLQACMSMGFGLSKLL
ncbi:MAG: NAD(P)/FAD-dependent oxidoreductase, partial [Flavobacteriales bacterium]